MKTYYALEEEDPCLSFDNIDLAIEEAKARVTARPGLQLNIVKYVAKVTGSMKFDILVADEEYSDDY